MRIVAIVLGLCVSMSVFTQNYSSSSKRAIKLYEKANEHFRAREDAMAESLLFQSVSVDAEFIEAWFMLAQIYLDKKSNAKAVEYYSKGLKVDPATYGSGYLKIADLSYEIGAYADANFYMSEWKKYAGAEALKEEENIRLEESISFAMQAIENPVPFRPISLGSAVNTGQWEYWPSLSLDENTIYFTVLGPQNELLPKTRLKLQEDFYYARMKEGRWSDRSDLGSPVNTNSNEGAQSLTADGKFIFFTACNRPDGHGKMCDIYVSRIGGNGKWSAPLNLGNGINTTASEKHPSISADGRVLIFSSNRGGGEGGYDLWMSRFEDGRWQEPENMGDSINTSGMEQSPFLHPDQKTLYFSSDGWPGMGKGDIFYARLKEDGSWSKPSNLGYPINTYNEEVGLVVNASGTEAYYSSNRRAGTDTDILKFEIPEISRPDPVSYITGRVFDSRNMKGIEALFQLIDLNTGEIVMESASNKGEGDYIVGLPSGTEYLFNVSQQGYLFYSENFDLDEVYSAVEPMKKDIPLEPIRAGKLITLNNIFFATDSYVLEEKSRVELGKVYQFLNLNKGLRVEISGHTDNTGSASYNKKLSDQRAAEVSKYLVDLGIEAPRIESKGYGDTDPVADNSSEEGKAQNRRTELKILAVGAEK